MKIVKIYGDSDDIVYFENIDSAINREHEEHSPMGRTRDGTMVAEFYINSEDKARFLISGKLLVFATYGYDNEGVWRFAVSMVSEEQGLPQWPMRISAYENGYSTLIEIDVPEGEKVHVRQLDI